MAAPPSLRKVARELLGEVPEWTDRLLNPLNNFMSQVQEALTSDLTVSENLAACWVEVPVVGGQSPAALSVPGLKGRVPHAVTVVKVSIPSGGTLPTAPVWVDWENTTVLQSNGNKTPGVLVRQVFGLASGARATLRLKVEAQ